MRGGIPRGGVREALGWGCVAGLGSGLALLGHVLLLSPDTLRAAPHPLRTALALLSCGVVVVAGTTLVVALPARLLPDRLAAWLRPPAVAVAAALLPITFSWLAFGLWPGLSGPPIAVALVTSLAAVLAVVVRACARWRSSTVEGRPIAALGFAALAFLLVSRPAPEAARATAGPPLAVAPAEPPDPSGSLPGAVAPPRLVLLVTIDTLRADHLGLYGYGRATSPTLDRLGAEGLVLRDLTAASSGTVPSLATLMTGVHPECHGVVHQRGRLRGPAAVLAELFAANGFRTFAVVSNPLLTEHSGFARGFERFENLGDVPARVVREAVERRLAEGREPLFGWVHFMDPHTPYEPAAETFADFLDDASYSRRSLRRIDYGSFAGVKASRTLPPEAAAGPLILGDIVARYDGEIRTVDAALAELLAAAGRRAAPEETVLVLSADHGETLYRGPREPFFQHALDVYQSTVRVPGIVWAPGRVAAGSELTGVARHVDVAPTLLLLAGLAAPPGLAGGNVLDAARPGDTYAVARTAWWDNLSLLLLGLEHREPTLAISDGDWKYIRQPRSELDRIRGPRSWLYAWYSVIARRWSSDLTIDLARPRGERSADLDAEQAARLGAALDRHLAGASVGCAPAGSLLQDEEAGDGAQEGVDQKLRDLGYLD